MASLRLPKRPEFDVLTIGQKMKARAPWSYILPSMNIILAIKIKIKTSKKWGGHSIFWLSFMLSLWKLRRSYFVRLMRLVHYRYLHYIILRRFWKGIYSIISHYGSSLKVIGWIKLIMISDIKTGNFYAKIRVNTSKFIWNFLKVDVLLWKNTSLSVFLEIVNNF